MRTLVKALAGSALLFAMLAPAAWADGSDSGKNSVRWETVIGIVQAGNTVAGITGGSEPWSTLGGHAYVDLLDSTVAFDVKGLVLAGGNSIGTPATTTEVEGTLVCNPGATSQTVVSTPPVALDARGDAAFNGSFSASTAGCSPTAVAFLITIPSNNHWIANGAVRVP